MAFEFGSYSSGALQVGIEETFPSAKAQGPVRVDVPAPSTGTAANTVMFDQELSSPNTFDQELSSPNTFD